MTYYAVLSIEKNKFNKYKNIFQIGNKIPYYHLRYMCGQYVSHTLTEAEWNCDLSTLKDLIIEVSNICFDISASNIEIQVSGKI